MATLFIYSGTTPLAVGVSVFSNSGLTTPAPNGVYSNGTDVYTVVGGVITNVSPCPAATTTTTTAAPVTTTTTTAPVTTTTTAALTTTTTSTTLLSVYWVYNTIQDQGFYIALDPSISVGQFVTLQGQSYCYEVIEVQTPTTTPTLQTVTGIFNDNLCGATTTTTCACPAGFTYNSTLGLCEKNESIPATPPPGATTYTYTTNGLSDPYSSLGLATYSSYNANGTGTYTLTSQNTELFGTGTWQKFLVSQGISLGLGTNPPGTTDPFSNTTGNQKMSVTQCVTLTESKTYYVVMNGDNWAGFKVDGATIVDMDRTAMNASLPRPGNYVSNNWDTTFSYTHVYPITLPAGDHILEFFATNEPPTGQYNYMTLAAWLWGGTLGELQALNTWQNFMDADSNGKIVFNTKNKQGTTTTLGSNLEDWTCPAGYTLNKCTTGNPTCDIYSQYVCGQTTLAPEETTTTTVPPTTTTTTTEGSTITTTTQPQGIIVDGVAINVASDAELLTFFGQDPTQIILTANIDDNGTSFSFPNYNAANAIFGYSDEESGVLGAGGSTTTLTFDICPITWEATNRKPVVNWVDANGVSHSVTPTETSSCSWQFVIAASEADMTNTTGSNQQFGVTINVTWDAYGGGTPTRNQATVYACSTSDTCTCNNPNPQTVYYEGSFGTGTILYKTANTNEQWNTQDNYNYVRKSDEVTQYFTTNGSEGYKNVVGDSVGTDC